MSRSSIVPRTIIIFGGENIISTIKVEATFFTHLAMAEAVVIDHPVDEYLGKRKMPLCMFIMLKEGSSVNAEEVITFCWTRHDATDSLVRHRVAHDDNGGSVEVGTPSPRQSKVMSCISKKGASSEIE
jgi:acyl-CoA synthetase (AMP-forming)/AMP-acid ligase II